MISVSQKLMHADN